MFALGLQGSPRKKGNTDYLLTSFMKEIETYHIETQIIQVCKQNIIPCKELIVCEKKGYCPLKDDMEEVYRLIRKADIIVMASPVFFYSISAQLKGLVDRCQMFWGRKYKLGLKDPRFNQRQGFVLSAGASRGKNLFTGVHLVAEYFFDAVSCHYNGSLTYRNIEAKDDMSKHPHAEEDIRVAAHSLCSSFSGRKKVLFISRRDTFRSQIAGAFAQIHGAQVLEVFTGGITPGNTVSETMMAIMEEIKIDMKYRQPQDHQHHLKKHTFDMIITLSSTSGPRIFTDPPCITWEVAGTPGNSIDEARQTRDLIESKVKSLLAGL